jgi:predicted nucleic acid-binding Zn ribbon protein
MPSKKVGDILPGVMKSLGLDTKLRETQLAREWREIVGTTMARQSSPGGVRSGVLLVEVENNVWMQEVRFHQREIIARIRERFPELGVEGLRLQLKREREAE